MEKIIIKLISIIVTAAICAALLIAVNLTMYKIQEQKVLAAAENNCEVIGTVGPVTVSRCEDPDSGTILYVNSVGMLEVQK